MGRALPTGCCPSTAYIVQARSHGDSNIVIGGLPASTASALQRGDLLEVRPNGVAADFPHLYEVMVDGATDAGGNTGVEVRPRLRRGIAVGDMVQLAYPSSVFHLSDDSQGEIELSAPNFANHGFSLVEAIERA
ncbi:hypothetical protein ACVWXO_008117 [Bradyrhizobium sp. LM2.7]